MCISQLATTTRGLLKHRWPPFLKLFVFKIFFFKVDHFLKVLLNLLQYCFSFMFWLFGHETRGIDPAPLAQHGKALTTGPPGESSTPEVVTQQL